MKKTRKQSIEFAKITTRLIAGALIMSLCLMSLAGCKPLPKTTNANSNKPNTSNEMINPNSYDEIYDVLSEIFSKTNSRESGGFAVESALGAEVAVEDVAPLSSEEPSSAEANQMVSGEDYSDTNTQVSGIDEADFVKTNGKQIYMISGKDIVVVEAKGAETKEIARISLDENATNNPDESLSISARELFLSGDTLVVLYDSLITKSSEEEITTPFEYGYFGSFSSSRTVTEMALYNVSDPKNPSFISTFGQDGYYLSSRLQDGIIYLISIYYVSDTSLLARENPESFVPVLSAGNEKSAIEASDVCILPNSDSTSYSVITSLDVSEAKRIDQQSILGSTETTYMSYGNLYLAANVYKEEIIDSRQDGSFLVEDHQSTQSTRISKFSLEKGTIDFKIDTLIPGALINQFALDEFEGYLRAVTTVQKSTYRTLTEEENVIYDWNSSTNDPSTNALFVLDEELNIDGSIEGLAEEERVYSVRFDGAVGYFVTFRQVDPLFAVDLSDPANPHIKSELKIPGFSSYMQVFGEDRLLGFGMDADKEGRTQGLKLSMFDTSDPYNITQKHVTNLDESNSEALLEHKAILVDSEKNLIGFPTEKGYLIYGYSDGSGFFLQTKINFTPYDWWQGSRGLFIDTFFYICQKNRITVVNLESFAQIAQITIEGGEEPIGIVPLTGTFD